MEGSSFEQDAFFAALARAQAVLIGRAALVAYGLPVVTADYDVWLDIDGIQAFNEALAPLGLVPNRTPAEARARGRYVLENDERVDVVVGRTFAGLSFAEVWARREVVPYGIGGIELSLASIADLIQMKTEAGRPKDLQDVEQLRALLAERNGGGGDDD